MICEMTVGDLPSSVLDFRAIDRVSKMLLGTLILRFWASLRRRLRICMARVRLIVSDDWVEERELRRKAVW